MVFNFDHFMIAQIIGLFGYLIYISAPHFKSRLKIQSIELLSCTILCLHWYMMDIPVMFWGNVIWVYMIITSIARDFDRRAIGFVAFSYILVGANAYIHWENTLIDYTALIGLVLAVTCRFYTDLFKFRGYAFTSGIFVVTSSACALSVPGVIFNGLFTLGHGLGLFKLAKERYAITGIKPLKPALLTIRIHKRY